MKGRQEPCHIVEVLDILAALQNKPADEVAEQVYKNTLALFWPNEAP